MHSRPMRSESKRVGNRRWVGGWVVLSGLVLGLATGAHAADGRQQPPSSLKPSGRAGKIEITHERHKVDSCHKVQEDGEKICKPKAMSKAASDTKITLKPLGASGKVDPADKRKKQTVEFGSGKGRQAKTVSLGPGLWELSWVKGGPAKDRFRVEPGDAFHIGLESFKGVCQPQGGGCKLLKSKGRKSIEIPVDRVLE